MSLLRCLVAASHTPSMKTSLKIREIKKEHIIPFITSILEFLGYWLSDNIHVKTQLTRSKTHYFTFFMGMKEENSKNQNIHASQTKVTTSISLIGRGKIKGYIQNFFRAFIVQHSY